MRKKMALPFFHPGGSGMGVVMFLLFFRSDWGDLLHGVQSKAKFEMGMNSARGEGRTRQLVGKKDPNGRPGGSPANERSAVQLAGVSLRHAFAAAFALGLLLASSPAMSQGNGAGWSLINGNLQKRVDGILTLMSYTLFPDVTTSTLSVTNQASGNPGLMMTQLGGGFTVSRPFPLYLEGNAAYSRSSVRSGKEAAF